MKIKLIIIQTISFFILFLGILIGQKDNYSVIRDTVNFDLNHILKNYKEDYDRVNTKMGKVFKYNTISIIDDYKIKMKDAIEKLDFFVYKNYINKIITAHGLIKKIKEEPNNNYYEKIRYHLGDNQIDNAITELDKEACEKILFLIQSINAISKPYFLNLNNRVFYKFLGKNEDILLSKITKYENLYSLVTQEIKGTLEGSAVSAKKILDEVIIFFENYIETKAIHTEIDSINDLIKKEIVAIDNEIEINKQVVKTSGVSHVYDNKVERLKSLKMKKNSVIRIIEKLKISYSKAIAFKKKADNLSWYNIYINSKIIIDARKIINEIKKLHLELEALDSRLQVQTIDSRLEKNHWFNFDKTKATGYNILEIVALLKKLSSIIYEKKDIYSLEVLNIAEQLTSNIEYFQKIQDIPLEDKKNIDSMMSILEILKLIKRPSEKYKLKHNDFYCNYILATLFFSNDNQEEIFKKITTFLQYIKIDMKEIIVGENNIFFIIVSMIKKAANTMWFHLNDVELELLKVNLYISVDILLEMLNPKKAIEETFIYDLYTIVSNRNKKNGALIKQDPVYKISDTQRNQKSLGGFGTFLFEKSKLIFQSISSFFKRPVISKISIIEDHDNDTKSNYTASTNEDENKIRSDFFSDSTDIPEEEFYDIDESLWEKIIEKENINNKKL
jgi:hypothetical protein